MTSDAIHFLTVPPSREVAEQGLPPALRAWFAATYGEPTLAQRLAWPTLMRGDNFLLSSPTGSGKTLAAFMPIVADVLTNSSNDLHCLYVAPLKALCRDVSVNLKRAWRSMQQAGFFCDRDLRIGVRIGDTSQRVRRRHLRHPPNILLTTPESLAQMLAHPRSHDLLLTVGCVVVDEIHALVSSKRGADFALSLERLEHLADRPLQRIGLSATCAPLATVARFLAGVGRSCTVAQVADAAEKRFAIEPLHPSQTYTPGWMKMLMDRLEPELATNQTTLIFSNTRNLAERVTWALRRRYPDRKQDIAVHHSAISMARRRTVERRLKQGRLWTVVTSTSLELGIDIGAVDHVIFIHPPGGVVRLLQRVGRSGHRPDQPRRGLLLTASPGELLEATVTAGSGRDGHIEPVRMPDAPLDVLCQQLAGMAMTALWSGPDALAMIRKAAPYARLSQQNFDDCLRYLLGQKRDGSSWLPPRLAMESDVFTIVDEKTARLLRRNLGTILTEDACTIRLRESSDFGGALAPRVQFDARSDSSKSVTLGEIDQAYADRLQPGDRFVLDGRCLELKKRDEDELLVDEVFGRPAVPRWLGSGVPMPSELAQRIFHFRIQAGEILRDGCDALLRWLAEEYHLEKAAADQLIEFFEQQETVSAIPGLDALWIEAVSMQSCIECFVHTPLPRAANDALARVLCHRWKRDRRIDAMVLAADLGVYLMVPDGGNIALADWYSGLAPERFADDWNQHLARSELLAQSFARTAQVGLMVLRNPLGRKRKVGGRDWTERRLFDQIREADSNFVLLRQAEAEVATAVCDVNAALAFANRVANMPIRVRHLPQPSPFGESIMNGGMRGRSQ